MWKYIIVFHFSLFSFQQLTGQTLCQYGITHRLVSTNFRNGDSTILFKNYPRGLELSVSRTINKNLSISMPMRAGFTKGSEDTINRTYLSTDLILVTEVKYKRFLPYIGIGVSQQYRSKKWSLGLPISGGINLQIDENLYLNLNYALRLPLSKKSKEIQEQYGIGLNIRFGKKENPQIQPLQQENLLEEVKDSTVIASSTLLEDTSRTTDMYNAQKMTGIHNDVLQIDSITNSKTGISEGNTVISDSEVKNSRIESLPQNDISKSNSTNNTDLTIEKYSIYFNFDQNTIDSRYNAYLDSITKRLEDNKSLKMKIYGYADNIGTDVYNLKLSQERAKNCFLYFVKKGISPTRLIFIGYGEKNPLFDNNSKKGQKLNRRVDLHLLLTSLK